MEVYHIYKVINKLDGKVYIGQTRHPIERRFKDHCRSNSGCTKLLRAIQKYGKEQFAIEPIFATFTEEDADDFEKHFIAQYDSVKTGYNLRNGACRGHGKAHSEETKEKIRIKATGRKHSPETLKKMSESHKGQVPVNKGKKGFKQSEETKAKLSASLKGRPSPMKGRHHSEESKQKSSQSHKGLLKGRKLLIVDGKKTYVWPDTKPTDLTESNDNQ